MPRVIGMDVHRDFAQVVALENERLRQLGRVKLNKDSPTSFANHLASDDEVVLEATGNTFAIVGSVAKIERWSRVILERMR